jgi:hypothetical protein
MFLLVQSPRFSTGTPEVVNSENRVSFALPLLNTGTGTAVNVRVTGITLGSAVRLSPPLPLTLGDLGVDNAVSANARFSASGLTVGGRYLVTGKGTYQSEAGATFGFSVNRYIVIPSPVEPSIRLLKAHVNVAPASGIWSYTLFNDEAPESSQFINAFSLDVVAPVTVIGTPSGWDFQTDNASFVLWFATEQQPPYTQHIAPGASLGGFSIQSARSSSEATGYSLTAWDHQNDQAGLVTFDAVYSPARTG